MNIDTSDEVKNYKEKQIKKNNNIELGKELYFLRKLRKVVGEPNNPFFILQKSGIKEIKNFRVENYINNNGFTIINKHFNYLVRNIYKLYDKGFSTIGFKVTVIYTITFMADEPGYFDHKNFNFLDLYDLVNTKYLKTNRMYFETPGFVTKTIIFSEKELEQIRNNPNFDIRNAAMKRMVDANASNANVTYFGIIGFKVIPVNDRYINDEKVFYDYIKTVKAFSPNCDYNFHKQTICSTTKDRLCIYQTYYYLFVDQVNIKKYEKDIKNKLELESSIIKKCVKEGRLVDFLVEKNKETNEEYIIEFYKPFDSEIKGIKLNKDGIHKITKYEDMKNKKVFLYDKQHVAPRISILDDKIKRVGNKLFTLRPNKIKGNSNKLGLVLGYDFETYTDKEYNCIPYCLSLSNGTSFYGNDIVKKFCDYLDSIKTEDNISKTHSKDKIPKIMIYGFNNSRFDNIFIFDELLNRNPSTKYVIMGSSIKFIKYYNINIIDLNLYYAGSLNSVGQAFKLNISKGVYPYKFVNDSNIYYKGEVPELKYWNSKEDYDRYIKEEGKIFDNEIYTKKYCILDATLVYEIAIKHLDQCVGSIMVEEYVPFVLFHMSDRKVKGKRRVNYDVRSSPTAAGLSLKLFQQVFLNEPLYSSPLVMQEKERAAYKGGRTEVFKKNFIKRTVDDKLYYYDINSSYPFAMTDLMPVQYKETIKMDEKKRDSFHDQYLYLARSVYKGNKKEFINNLLARSDKGDIISTSDIEYNYQWGCELNEAIKNGSEIYIKEINTYSTGHILKEFAEYFYASRLECKTTNPAKAEFYKLVMNSLYGKFGQSIKNETKICKDKNEMMIIVNNPNNKIKDFDIVNNKVLVKYENIKNSNNSIGNMVRFSSYIAARARCNLSEFMRDVGHENVYYCDTDSVFTSKRPSDYLVDQSKLGKWKLEEKKYNQGNILLEFEEADFLAPKSYICKVKDVIIMKAKGHPARKLESIHYDEVKEKGFKEIENDTMFFRTLEGVKIKPQSRKLQCVYNKRVFDGNDSAPYKTYKEWYDQRYL